MFEALVWVILMIYSGAAEGGGAPQRQAEFEKSVQPILAQRCQPCHFPGGVMHEKLPFDRAETVDHLGTKLFSRIKKEEERAVIRAFLATAGTGSSK